MRSDRGQGLVELALVLPVVLFAALGFLEAGLLVGSRDEQARRTQTVADYAAQHPRDVSWADVAASELPGCDVEAVDSGHTDVVAFEATCRYRSVTRLAFDGLPVTTSASAAVDAADPVSAPAPAP